MGNVIKETKSKTTKKLKIKKTSNSKKIKRKKTTKIKKPKGTKLFTKIFVENHMKITRGLRMNTQIHGISDEDITQEAFLKCWLKRKIINPEENPLGYIRKTAENTRNGTFNSNLSKKKMPHSLPNEDGITKPMYHISLEFLADESSTSYENDYVPKYNASLNGNGFHVTSLQFNPESIHIENNRIANLQNKLNIEENKILECLINPEQGLIKMSMKEIKIEEKHWGERKNYTITDRHIASYLGIRLVDVKNVKKKIVVLIKKEND